MLSRYTETCIRLLPCGAGSWAPQPLSPRCHLLAPPPLSKRDPTFLAPFAPYNPQRCPSPSSQSRGGSGLGGEHGGWGEWGKAEAIALPGRKKAVKLRASPHQRPAAPASPIRAIGGRGFGERGGQEGARRAPESSLEDEGGWLVAGGRSEDPGQPRSRRPGRGGLGVGSARGRNPGPGCRRLRGSADARRKLHESCPLRLLRSPTCPGPRPLLPRRAGLGRETHPRRARLPG